MAEMVECACGCGKQMPKFTKNGKRRHYWRGHGNSHKVTAICANCGTSFPCHVWRVEKFDVVFCNRDCQGQYSRKSETRSCDYCGKPITRKPGRFNGQHAFCNAQCHARYQEESTNSKILVHCAYCDEPIWVFPSKTKINQNFYCNIRCRAKHIVGSNNPAYTYGKGQKREYGNNWKSQRNKALKRDNHTCLVCGKSPKGKHHLHVHHIVPACTFNGDYEAANALSNLATLCWRCHKKVELGKIAFQPKLL